jgi:hypothetical protein
VGAVVLGLLGLLAVLVVGTDGTVLFLAPATEALRRKASVALNLKKHRKIS